MAGIVVNDSGSLQWWDSEWYKEWLRLAKEGSSNSKPDGCWRYDNVNGEWVYLRYED